MAGWARKLRLWILHGATLALVAGPLMGVSLPVHQLWEARPPGQRVRILTLNQGNNGYNALGLITLLDEQHIDIVCLQEGYTPPEGQADPILESYFRKRWHRNKSLTIASRWPIVEEFPPLDNPDGDESLWRARLNRVKVKAPSGAEFLVATVHMPSMYYALDRLTRGDVPSMQRHMAWRMEKMTLVASALASSPDVPLLVGGDFNMPSESHLMSTLQMTGLRYAFDEAGWGYGYTRPSTSPWVRIDHILAGEGWTTTRCWVGPDVGSDHLPLVAELILDDSATAPASKTSSNPVAATP
jgi:endonuclease/exonuclease/phosphatase (EEP) superfamily protein YafD